MKHLEIKNANKTWLDTKRSTEVVALGDVSLDVQEGEFVCIVGPSGCGKSTLLQLIAGIETPTAGTLQLDGEPISGPSWTRGVVFQEHALFPWLTVEDNIAFGLRVRGVPKADRERIVREQLGVVNLSAFSHSYPSQLSGGMKQRVGIARVLANDPKVMLLDEPFGALDAQTRQGLQTELLHIWEMKQKTVVFITHDIVEAVYLADRVVVMGASPGRIKEILPIDIPRDRSRTSREFASYCDRIEEQMSSKVFHRSEEVDDELREPSTKNAVAMEQEIESRSFL